MHLAFLLGRTTELARREALSVATTLPLPWTSSSVRGEFVVLKLEASDLEAAYEMRRLLEPVQARLGGTMRIMLLEDDSVSQSQLAGALADLALRARVVLAPDCRSVGVSVWGDVQAGGLGLSLKKLLKQKDWTIRAVLPKEGNVLTSAVVGGQRLATQPHGPEANGLELVAIAHEGKWQMGVTLTTNNIDFYSARDFDIPAPDPVSGMLPPKLAQMMINVAVGDTKAHVHDPFCGNGRIVLEAALMGLPATGSDIEPGKVAASQQNLAWLGEVAHFVTKSDQVWQGDATAAGNRDKILTKVGSQYVLVGEPYLGKPLRTPLKTSEKQAWLNDVTPQYLHYFETWTTATTQPLCHLLVIPRAKVENNTEVAVLDAIVDRLHQIGYSTEVLFCYDRPDSIVRRDIVRITKSQ